MRPVCAERAVLQGYNDLGTTDPHLLSEWDYEKNSKWTPSNASRNSMKVVCWKCGAGHSYRAKITDRTIEQKGCPQCEAEFQQALPQMLIMMYGAQNGITVKSNSDLELGMRLVAYLPELHCAVDIAGATVTEKREQGVKAHICQSNRLSYYLIKKNCGYFTNGSGNQNAVYPQSYLPPYGFRERCSSASREIFRMEKSKCL